MSSLDTAREVFDKEISALEKTRDALDGDFLTILGLITSCKGKVVVTGMGKPGHIAAKIAATLASLGTPAFHLHPAEAMHGDIGMIDRNDVVILISYSGESDEIIKIIPNLKMMGATIVGITGNGDSSLAKASDCVQVLPDFEEACHLGLAPTSSTTAILCYGDALAVAASDTYKFSDEDFGKRHPAGSLGKKLLTRVDDVMAGGEANAIIGIGATLMDAIVEITRKKLGMVNVVDEDGNLCGIIVNADLRFQMQNRADIYNLHVEDAMTKSPVVIESGRLAIDALNLMKQRHITVLPVVSQKKPIGAVMMVDILNMGIY